MLGPRVELGVVREVVRPLVVGRGARGARHVGGADAAELLAVVDDVLGALRQGHDLCLARGEGHAVLLTRAPGDCGALPHDDPAGGGEAGDYA